MKRMVALRPSLLDRFVDAPLWNSVPWSSTKDSARQVMSAQCG